tara:strand:- start:326 stop:1558 length:1233 start_codon:yes stop_codon:yes gene_type:complete
MKHNQQRWGFIYKLTNKVNEKYYFGKTIHFKERMRAHRRSAKKGKQYLARAIKKHGWENFNVAILIRDVPEEDLDNLERSYIEIYDSMNPKKGYNLTRGGEGTSGYQFTEEQRKRTSENMKKYHSKRDQFGTISYMKSRKAYIVRGPLCGNNKNGKYIGQYDTKKEAKNALEIYNKTGKKTASTRTRTFGCISTEQKKSGQVVYIVNGASNQLKRKGTYVGRYNTREEAENALKVFNTTGVRISSSSRIGKHGRKIGTGSILINKQGRFKANFKNNHIGYYATKKEAEKALGHFIETGKKLKSTIQRRKGHVEQRHGRFRAAYKNNHIGYYATKEEAEKAIQHFIQTGGEKLTSSIKKRTGSIRKYKSRFQASYSRKYLGTYSSEQEAEEAIKKHLSTAHTATASITTSV